MRVDAVGKREDVGARRHDFAHDLLAELHDAADDRDLFALADALELALAQADPESCRDPLRACLRDAP